MNTYIVYCNVCFSSLLQNPSVQFIITSCGKIVCNNCLPRLPQGCKKCGSKCSRKFINSQMDRDMAALFMDSSEQKKRIMNSDLFQQNRFKQLIKYLYQKNIHLEKKLQEQSSRFQALEKQYNSLDISYKKLKESYHYMQQRRQKPQLGQSNNPPFMGNLLDSINKQVNESTLASSSHSFFHSENVSNTTPMMPVNHFPLNRAATVTNRPKPRSIIQPSMDPTNHNFRIYQSTPLVASDHRLNVSIPTRVFNGYQAMSAISKATRRSRHRSQVHEVN